MNDDFAVAVSAHPLYLPVDLLQRCNSTMNGASVKLAILSFFLGMFYIFTMTKISLHWRPVQPFWNINHDFGHICFLKKHDFFWYKIRVITISKNAKFLVWEVCWKRNKCLLLPAFWTFQSPIGHLNLSIVHCWLLCHRHQQFGQKNFKYSKIQPQQSVIIGAIWPMQLMQLCRAEEVTCSWSCYTRLADRIFVHKPPCILTTINTILPGYWQTLGSLG